MIDHLEQLMQAERMEDVWSLHLSRMAEYGFDRLIYGFTRFRTAHSFGDLDDLLILSNHDKAYLDGFIRGGLYLQAPMVRWAADHEGAQSWSIRDERAARGELTAAERRVMEFNQAHGVVAGYTISFRDVSSRAKGAIGLCAQRGLRQAEVDAIWDRHGREILLLNNVTHLRITAMPYTTLRRSLSPRQREALEWVGDGKTTADIAKIMGLTPATIEKHLRLAREALEVDTTAQAVLKASFQNQIFVLEHPGEPRP